MDPRNLFLLANTLLTGSGAAEFRTAVNRAYYAAYNVGVEVLGRDGVSLPRTAQSHGELRAHLRGSDDVALQKASQQLGDLYRSRERADYEMSALDMDGRGKAQQAVSISRRVIEALDGFASQPDEKRRPAVNAMKRRLTRPGRTYQ